MAAPPDPGPCRPQAPSSLRLGPSPTAPSHPRPMVLWAFSSAPGPTLASPHPRARRTPLPPSGSPGLDPARPPHPHPRVPRTYPHLRDRRTPPPPPSPPGLEPPLTAPPHPRTPPPPQGPRPGFGPAPARVRGLPSARAPAQPPLAPRRRSGAGSPCPAAVAVLTQFAALWPSPGPSFALPRGCCRLSAAEGPAGGGRGLRSEGNVVVAAAHTCEQAVQWAPLPRDKCPRARCARWAAVGGAGPPLGFPPPAPHPSPAGRPRSLRSLRSQGRTGGRLSVAPGFQKPELFLVRKRTLS